MWWEEESFIANQLDLIQTVGIFSILIHIYIIYFPAFRSHNTLIRWVPTFLNELWVTVISPWISLGNEAFDHSRAWTLVFTWKIYVGNDRSWPDQDSILSMQQVTLNFLRSHKSNSYSPIHEWMDTQNEGPWKRWVLSNMAISGIYVKSLGCNMVYLRNLHGASELSGLISWCEMSFFFYLP